MPPPRPLSPEPSKLARRGPGDAAPWYGSRMIAVAFVSAFVSTGFIFSVYSVLIDEMSRSFGASMATMGMMPPLYMAMSAMISPFLGRNLASLGIRRLMIAGACLLPTGLVVVSRAGSTTQAALGFAGLAVLGSIAMGPLPSNTLLTNWYGPTRGRAMGLASVGSTMAGLILPPLAAFLIARLGWRDALAGLALLGATISLPTILGCAVDHPRKVGQQPEGETESEREAFEGGERPVPLREPPLSTARIVQRREFWLIAATFGLLFSVGLVSSTYTVVYGIELGFGLQVAAWIMMGRAAASVAGQIGLSGLSDRIGRRAVLAIVILGQAVAWWVIVSPPSPSAFVIGSLVFGFFSGALVALRGAMIASVFGRSDFSKVAGLMVPAALPFQAAAVPLAGLFFDRTGEWSTAFGAFFFVFPVAAILLCFIRDPHGVRGR